jgi:hypothetical protein
MLTRQACVHAILKVPTPDPCIVALYTFVPMRLDETARHISHEKFETPWDAQDMIQAVLIVRRKATCHELQEAREPDLSVLQMFRLFCCFQVRQIEPSSDSVAEVGHYSGTLESSNLDNGVSILGFALLQYHS